MSETKKSSNIQRISGYLILSKFIFYFALFMSILSTAANIYGTYLLRPIINNYIIPFIGRQEAVNFEGFIRIILLLSFVYLIGAVTGFAADRIMIRLSNNAMYNIRVDMHKHMQKLPIRYFDIHAHGDIMSIFTNDVNTLKETTSQGILQLASSFITVTVTFIVMLFLNPWLTLTIFVLLVVMFAAAGGYGNKANAHSNEQQKQMGALNGYVEEIFEGQNVVDAFCHHEQVINRFNELNDKFTQESIKAAGYSNIMNPLMSNLSYMHYAFVSAIGAIMVISGNMDLGALVIFLQYSRTFVFPLAGLAQQAGDLFMALAGAKRIFEFMDEEPEIDEGDVSLVNAAYNKVGVLEEIVGSNGIPAWKIPDGKGSFSLLKRTGKLTFDHVTFGYEEGNPILKDISFQMEEGKSLAVIGSTGAGKTTIVSLMSRFYEVWEGRITYDGILITSIRKEALRNSIAMVLQDTCLFSGTVADNIRYGRLNSSENEVLEASMLAKSHSFIEQLPNAYDTRLEVNGDNISLGQKQLLSIARAAIAKPNLLALDEATSSVDTRTEAIVQESLNELMKGRTTFIIAHRLSTIKNADNIIVLENGQIIEHGKHEDLIERKGRYNTLYTSS